MINVLYVNLSVLVQAFFQALVMKSSNFLKAWKTWSYYIIVKATTDISIAIIYGQIEAEKKNDLNLYQKWGFSEIYWLQK